MPGRIQRAARTMPQPSRRPPRTPCGPSSPGSVRASSAGRSRARNARADEERHARRSRSPPPAPSARSRRPRAPGRAPCRRSAPGRTARWPAGAARSRRSAGSARPSPGRRTTRTRRRARRGPRASRSRPTPVSSSTAIDRLHDGAAEVGGEHRLAPARRGRRSSRRGSRRRGTAATARPTTSARSREVADRQDGERQRDERDPVADDRQDLPGEQQAVARLLAEHLGERRRHRARVSRRRRARARRRPPSKFACTSPTSSLSSSVSMRRMSLRDRRLVDLDARRRAGSVTSADSNAMPACLERGADRGEVGRLGDDLEDVVVDGDVLGAGVDRDHQVVLAVARRRRRRSRPSCRRGRRPTPARRGCRRAC